MRNATHDHFWFCVTLPHARHEAASTLVDLWPNMAHPQGPSDQGTALSVAKATLFNHFSSHIRPSMQE
ncbi:hypothetical protein X769_28245 [Mesorhizobium sp. LSJC268A00]|uniref:hypothetical protein n=1 Tax=unclassified Mesorhizobium TaxID=325217 RepID=UPI0003CF53E5|nr:hypothetical protein [Mesorhizobium sp. LSJC268A00]ESW95645.1 hypothetical protein X769_28245 [Mesorhizobium sp. LSJC268A00]